MVIKIINHLIKHGNKKTTEKIILKSIKYFQKNSIKQSKKIIQLAIVFSTTTFKLHNIKKHKHGVPKFIKNSNMRSSTAIKTILSNLKKKNSKNYYIKLSQEILRNAQYEGLAVEIKTETHKQMLLNKRRLFYYT
jgi:ribosomal protein S7